MGKERLICIMLLLICFTASTMHSFTQTTNTNSNNDTIIVGSIGDTTNNNKISNDSLPSFPQEEGQSPIDGYQEFSFEMNDDGLTSSINYTAKGQF